MCDGFTEAMYVYLEFGLLDKAIRRLSNWAQDRIYIQYSYPFPMPAAPKMPFLHHIQTLLRQNPCES